MANIAEKTEQIRKAVLGKDVRESIAIGIETINSEVENNTRRQDTIDANEAGRIAAENVREHNESNRQTTFEANETARGNTFTTNESARQTNFNTAENARQTGENSRVNAEIARVNAENSRVSQFTQIKADYNTASKYNVVTYDDWIFTASKVTDTFEIEMGIFNPLLDIAELSHDGIPLSENDHYSRLGAEITLGYNLNPGDKINIRIFKGVIMETPTGADGSLFMNGSISKIKLSADVQDKITKSVKAIDFTGESVNVENDIHPLVKEQLDLKADKETVESLLNDIATNVKIFGAKGDGVTDDSNFIATANSMFNYIAIVKGTFRVSQNINLGTVCFVNGGSISIDSGVIVTIDNVICDNSIVCFKGLGTIKINNNKYSLGWYEGNTANKKWDFLRRGFESSVRKYVYVPSPKLNDPACVEGIFVPNAWAVDAPLLFGDPENELIFDCEAIFSAIGTCKQMFVFSNTNEKTEEIHFTKGLYLEGGHDLVTPIAEEGIVIHGGARVKFSGITRCKTFSKYGVNIDCYYRNVDEIDFDFLECTGFGIRGLNIAGTTSNANLATNINYYFSNGGYATADSFVKVSGTVRQFKIGKFHENISSANGLTDVTIADILIESNSNGYPKGVCVEDVFCEFSTKPTVKTINNSGTTKNTNINIANTNVVSSVIADLAYTVNSSIKTNSTATNSIVIASDCDGIDIETLRPDIVSGNCPRLRVNGQYYYRATIGDNSVGSFGIYSNVTGRIDIVCDDINDVYAILYIRKSGAMMLTTLKNKVEMTSTVPTGTTGNLNVATICLNNQTIYLENRLGLSLKFAMYITG